MQEQARKALESALGGKKNEFEKWDQEIKKREESGGGNGGGGWFGGRGWFGGDHFWGEAQQIGITLLAIILVVCFCLLIQKWKKSERERLVFVVDGFGLFNGCSICWLRKVK